ncbi:MAG TPA: alpha/beta fold hydrolase [Vicinamibacterales bacterium]|nr:alpha/beta fold hydrolase [Vicinamibacterales bacterium]
MHDTSDVTCPGWLDRMQYPFRSRTVQLAAGRMHYVDEGSGEVLLFVHGTPTWSFEFRHLIAAFRDQYRGIALDRLGFGLSERPPAFAYSPEAHAAALAEFVDAIGIDLFARADRLRRYPVLIVWGMKDSAFRPYQLARWQQIVSEARIARRTDAGHWPHEEEPDRVIAEIDAFLRSTVPAA